MDRTVSTDALVTCEVHDRVLLVRMERHAKRNAVDRALADALDAALNRLDDDRLLWAGVLTGGPFFSAGSDLASRGDYVTERGGEYGVIRRARRKPLIAAVEGAALGGGMEIVLACDMAVAASDARFGLPEVALGLVPTCGALFRALDRLPPNVARELVLTGLPIDAARALQLGLVNAITEPGQACAHAMHLAAAIAKNSPTATQACLAAMNGLLARGDTEGWAATQHAIAAIRGSEDAQEGIKAFFERRAPVWRGR